MNIAESSTRNCPERIDLDFGSFNDQNERILRLQESVGHVPLPLAASLPMTADAYFINCT